MSQPIAVIATLCFATSAYADSVSTRTRSTSQIAPGVYVIRHEDAPDTFPQGNTTVVIGERAVLVVDSCYLPSSARQDIAQIRQWTSKPVRWLVNTHWHYDHTMGNGAYRDAFPGIDIVAQVETRKQIAGYDPQWFAKFPERAATFQKVIDTHQDADGHPVSDADLADYRTGLAGLVPVGAEFRALAGRTNLAPNLGFDRELDLDLGGREARLLFLGRGNTAGDAVLFLPRERIVAAGDLLDHPIPYLGGGYPIEEIATLEALRALHAETIVPGHGEVLHGDAYLDQVIGLLRAVVAAVDDEIHKAGGGGRHLDEVKKAVLTRADLDLAGWRQRFAGSDAEARDFFDSFSLDGLITAAYAELWPR